MDGDQRAAQRPDSSATGITINGPTVTASPVWLSGYFHMPIRKRKDDGGVQRHQKHRSAHEPKYSPG